MSYSIKQAEKADLDYILSSWLHAYKLSPEMRMVGLLNDEYYYHQHKILDELISRASEMGSLYVAHLPGAPHLIRGYLCAEPHKNVAFIHWVQVKKPDWNKGIATGLINQFKQDFQIPPEANLLYTHSAMLLQNKAFARKAQERFNLVYWPWYKYTSQPFGWETGNAWVHA